MRPSRGRLGGGRAFWRMDMGCYTSRLIRRVRRRRDTLPLRTPLRPARRAERSGLVPRETGAMKLVNPQVQQDLRDGRPLRLNVGAGYQKGEGIYSLDLLELPGVDIVADLNRPLDLLPDDCAESIVTRHTLEHIQDLTQALREMHRITRPGGTIDIVVPHWSQPYYYSDPTHVRFFGLYTMYYFVAPGKQPAERQVPAFYNDLRFVVDSVRIEFERPTRIDRMIGPWLNRLVNRSHAAQDFYERRLAYLFPAWEIHYRVRPDKG